MHISGCATYGLSSDTSPNITKRVKDHLHTMEVAAPPTYSNWTLIKRFFTYYRPHRKLFVLDFSCAVLSGVLELGFPMAVGLSCCPARIGR